jgi:hypothetical protein
MLYFSAKKTHIVLFWCNKEKVAFYGFIFFVATIKKNGIVTAVVIETPI